MQMIEMNNIGGLIRQLRERKGYTQQQLADMLWLPRQTIDGWENGEDMSFADVLSVMALLDAKIIIKLPD